MLNKLELKPKSSLFKRSFLKDFNLISKCFLLMYSCIREDENDIFYQKEPTEDLNMFIDAVEYYEPANLPDHLKSFDNAKNTLYFWISVASKVLKKPNSCCMLGSLMYNAMVYKCSRKDELLVQCQTTLNLLDTKRIGKLFDLKKSIDEKECMKDKKNKLNMLIYIPITERDSLTLDNLDSTAVPIMIREKLDLEHKTELKKYDCTKHIRVRVLANKNWLKEVEKNPQFVKEFDTLILEFHGGGFVIGSSHHQTMMFASLFARDFDGPIFMVDYRLGPDHKFPDGLNDCWKTYLWVVNYAEKYLHVRFKKIILLGDSAGGNLVFGVTNLSIQKNVRVPDGIIGTYPAMSTSFGLFSPSLLLSFDDIVLNMSTLMYFVDSFAENDDKIRSHYLLSPRNTPEEFLGKYPPTRFITSGLDPLRDDSIRFMIRLLKKRIDVRMTEFRYQTHGFYEMGMYPLKLKEALSYVPKLHQLILELSALE